jgi:hypothetical protein
VAWIVYRHLGLRVLRVLRATWFNLDVVWALSLIASGPPRSRWRFGEQRSRV